MVSRVRSRNFDDPAEAWPALLQPGEIAVNTTNRQIAVGDAVGGAPYPLLPLRYFSTNAHYAIDDIVIFEGNFWRAKVVLDSPPLADPVLGANWDDFEISDVANKVTRGGDTMTGQLNLVGGGAGANAINYDDTNDLIAVAVADMETMSYARNNYALSATFANYMTAVDISASYIGVGERPDFFPAADIVNYLTAAQIDATYLKTVDLSNYATEAYADAAAADKLDATDGIVLTELYRDSVLASNQYLTQGDYDAQIETYSPVGHGHGTQYLELATGGNVLGPVDVSDTNLLSGQDISARRDISAVGDISAQGDVTAFASDERLKTNIERIPEALNKVLQMSGCTFDWNELAEQEFGLQGTNKVGLIAQDVQAVFPQAAKPMKDNPEYMTVSLVNVVPLLVQAIQELTAMVCNGSEEGNGS